MMKHQMTKIAAVIFMLAASAGMATPKTIALPPETAKIKESTHPGYQVALQKCSICHSADYINLQPPGMSLKQWTAEVSKMKLAFGAPINDDEVKLIGEYLVTTYGSEKTVMAEVSTNTQTNTSSPNAMDAKSLLAKNTCLGCHAVDKKVVGPAFHDVAERYRKNPQGMETIMANIKNGGSGKWASTPMPPFTALSDADLKTLATFVLNQ